MFLKKLLYKLDKTARGTLAVGLAALLGATVMAAVLTSGGTTASVEDQRPTLRFRCMDFALIEDGSIQAKVRLSVENMSKFNATGFNIKFNPYYIQPAYLETKNGEETQTLVTDSDGDGKHFERDSALMVKTSLNHYVSPLVSDPSDTNYKINSVVQGKLDGSGEVAIGPGGDPELGRLSMYFELDSKLLRPGITTPSGTFLGNYPKSKKYTVATTDSDGNPMTGSDGKPVTHEEYDLVQVMDVMGYCEWEGWRSPADGRSLYMDASGTVDAKGMDKYRLVEEVAASGSTPAKGHGQGIPGNGVNLGSITFKVNPDHLTEMVLNYNKFGASGAGATDLHEFLLGYRSGEETNENNAWFISDYVLEGGKTDNNYIINKRTPGNRYGDQSSWNQTQQNAARVVIDFIFPKVLVKAEVAGGKDLTVNAYQAYGTGKSSDIAATVQRYRPEITATLADAMSTNYVMDWGDTTPITTTRGGGYKVYRPYNAAKDGSTLPANGYIDRAHRDTPTNTSGWWVPLKDSEYDPRGGKYMVTQYFWYEEDGQTKMFPQPMEVCLTVTPVELVDVNAEGLTGTYSKAQAETFKTSDLAAFKLPREAVLSLAPVPGPIVLTMPISTWTPKSIAALTTANGQAQNWSAEGTYRLSGPNASDIKTYVKKNYPWVTTDHFNKGINATRTVVANSDYSDVSYTAKWVSTTYNSNNMTELQLQVGKKVGNGDVSFVSDSINDLPRFRTYLPGGQLIDTGTELPHRPAGSTAQASNGAYSTYEVNADATLHYIPGTATRTAHQEDVSRSINLGGWFYVSVCEELDGGNEKWSELIPVYVPPRINYYIGQSGKSYYDPGTGAQDSHYFFDFTGVYAGLYPFYSNSVLPANVVLPIGYTVGTTYDGFTGAEPGAVGQFWVEKWASAEENDPSHTAPSPSPWCGSEPMATPQPKYNIINYGKPADPPATVTDEPKTPTDFKDANYSNYGNVENHDGQIHTNTALERVRVRVQAPEYVAPPVTSADPSPTPGPVDKPEEKIRLIHEDSVYSGDNIPQISRDANNEVTETTYTMRSEGYVQRETFTLTIVNEGTTDIYGLNVDLVSSTNPGPKPAYTTDVDHHFEVLVPPAAYLPAGGSTTFVVTYANNLPDLDPTEKGTLYEDNILITSNAHDVTDPLKEYIANFEVMGDDAYRVTLEIRPDPSVDLDGDGTPDFPDYGTAKLVVGPAASAKPTLPTGTLPGSPVLIQVGADDTPPVAKPSETGTGDTYVAGHEYVWVKPEPNDEYKVKSIFYIDGYESDGVTEKRVNLYTYEWRDTGKTTADAADSTIYFFKMPAKDVTVVVEYYEPIYAKLRLSQLMGYVGIDGEGTVDQLPNAAFIDEGKRHNVRWYDDTTKIIQTDPNYTETEGGNTIYVMTPKDSSRPKRPDYVIVLGDYANTTNDGRAVDDMTLVALRARLRKNILSPDIDDVGVEFRNYDLATGNTSPMNSYADGKTWHLTSGAPTYHNSYVFAAPPKSTDGKVTRTAVRITLRCTLTAAMIAEDPTYTSADVGRVIERHFVVVIVRPAAVDSVLNYGNSPKGMIYNNTKISDAAKAAAWTNFKNSNYKFNTSNRPAKAAGLNNTYWKEAWGGITYVKNDADTDATNYDEDRYALFLILGQPFQDPGFQTLVNSAGFNVDPAKIRRSVKVDLLDTSATTQRQRFNGAKTNGVLNQVTLNLGNGDKGLVTSTTSGDVISDWWKLTTTETNGNKKVTDQAVRPGVYTLTYSFPDYNSDYDSNGNVVDGSGNAVAPIVVTRPVIILAPVGDVNADRTVDTSDSGYIQNRVAEPLGCMYEPNTGTTLDYPAWRLFRYRCCDTNNDRNINNIDANQLIRKATLVPYYKPTDYVSK